MQQKEPAYESLVGKKKGRYRPISEYNIVAGVIAVTPGNQTRTLKRAGQSALYTRV